MIHCEPHLHTNTGTYNLISSSKPIAQVMHLVLLLLLHLDYERQTKHTTLANVHSWGPAESARGWTLPETEPEIKQTNAHNETLFIECNSRGMNHTYTLCNGRIPGSLEESSTAAATMKTREETLEAATAMSEVIG